ncbi:MAG: hypothetical protein ACFCVE_10285 [Phycisphaerae bacterium]
MFILLTLISGCAGQMADRVAEVVMFGPDRSLTVALYAYREGAGHWPESPDVLAESAVLDSALCLDRYEGLQFDALDDGRLAVSFDRYASPDGKVVWGKDRFVFGEPAAQ